MVIASNTNRATMSFAEKNRSITRILQHSILQLCNEHIGYSHKLQILGVLCMTVDDEQQELVVKVNNTLKRVTPNASKDISNFQPQPELSGSAVHIGAPAHLQVAPHLPVPVANAIQNCQTKELRSESPSQLVCGSRRSHGRKGTRPVKVHHVIDLGEPTSDDEEPITVIPEAPESDMTLPLANQDGQEDDEEDDDDDDDDLIISEKALAPNKRLSSPPTGSAKRKSGYQMRVPQYSPVPDSSTASPPTGTSSPHPEDSQGSSNSTVAFVAPPASSPSSRASPSENGIASVNGSPSHMPPPQYVQSTPRHLGLSLPVIVAGSPISGESRLLYSSDVGASGQGELLTNNIDHNSSAMDGEVLDFSGRANGGASGANSPSDNNNRSLYVELKDNTIRIKEEPHDDYYEYNSSMMDTSTSLDDSQNISSDSLPVPQPIMTVPQLIPTTAVNLTGTFADLPSQVPYSGLALIQQRISDGLSIRYTSTGPITVGTNGREVSNASRIKDIILYNEQSPVSQQKGSRIEADLYNRQQEGQFMVDKFGSEGRKRRRRNNEDQLTPEEVAEYMGQGNNSSVNFKCKYCAEEFQNVARYMQHTLTTHGAYICHQCGKSFTTKSSLLRHRPIHTGMRRFACSICKKTFYRKDKCKAHIKRHLGSDQTVMNSHIEHPTEAAD